MAGRGHYCLSIGGEREAVLQQKRLAVERAQYVETRAKRAYNAVDPENRRVARVREREWEQRMAQLEEAHGELQLAESQQPRELDAGEEAALLAWSEDLPRAWEAPTTTMRDRKELLRTLLDEVVLTAPRDSGEAHIRMVWRSGQFTDLVVPRPSRKPRAAMRTSEETVALLRRLAALYPDAVIAGVLNRQGRRTARGLRFTQARVASLRKNWKIACYRPPEHAPGGEVVNVRQAARQLGVAPSTIHRMLNEGFLAGEQVTPGSPVEDPPDARGARALRGRDPAGLRADDRCDGPLGGVPSDRAGMDPAWQAGCGHNLQGPQARAADSASGQQPAEPA